MNSQDKQAANLESFLNLTYGVIGRTVSTKFEPNTSSKFHFWLSDLGNHRVNLEDDSNQKIAPVEIGNIVAAYSDALDDITFGLVIEMRSYSDVDSFIADFLSHNFGDAVIEVPTDISEVIVVTCSTMRSVSLKSKPVGRSRVYFPSALGVQLAYGIVDENGESLFSGAPIPIGVFENGDKTTAPVSVDEDFLVGPEGAHLNVSGISGLASKTSAVEFTIKSLLTHSQKRIAIVMFNVKSKDLLYIDQKNLVLENSEGEWSKMAYEALGIDPLPFGNSRFFAPADSRDPYGTQSLRKLETERFTWDLSLIYEDVPSLFNPLDWDDKMEGVWYTIREWYEHKKFHTYTQMLKIVDAEIQRANKSNQQWLHGNHIATWSKMTSHLKRFPITFDGLITSAGKGEDIPWNNLEPHSVFVIDIQMLNDRGQRLVFGRSIRAISEMLEEENRKLDAIVVFVDELNKFAPSGNTRSPLKSSLIDITARGRSLGLILFGSEQFSSSVDKEVVENSSTYLYGRTETNELRTPNFSMFSDEVKAKLTMLPQGNLLIKFAKFPQPIFLRFPYPPCLPGDKYTSNEKI